MSDKLRLTLRYLRYVFRYRKIFAAMVVCMVGVGLLEPLLPTLLAPLIDINSGKPSLLPASLLPFVFFAIVVVRGACSYGVAYLGGWLEATVQRDLRGEMAAHLAKLPGAKFSGDTMGLTTTRFLAFVSTLTAATVKISVAVFQDSIKLVFYLSLLFYFQWQLALIMLVASPPVILVIRTLGGRMRRLATTAQQYHVESQNRLNEAVRLWPVIKVHGSQNATSGLRGIFSRVRGAIIRMNIVLSIGQPLTHTILAVAITFVLWYVVAALESGAMSAGQVASFMTIMLLIQVPVRNLTRCAAVWGQMLAAAAEVFAFLDSPAESDDGKKTAAKTRGAVSFESVSFSYPNGGYPALDNLSLRIAPKETVALVGKSGAGKTTLANLLPRFYSPQSGTVRLDGDDINELTLQSLRQQIALVTQDSLLFDDTVANNVAYPEDGAANPQKVAQALRDAAAADFVAALPQGADTRIGENGGELSGGQRQRLALARAFYKDAPILILDEATSALDSETETAVKEAMRRLLAGRTAIIIAHRFATVDFADRVAVLDEGKLLACGTVEELLSDCPLFANLYRAQTLRQ